MANNLIDSEQSFSSVAQTASLGSSTSVSSGAAKIFREFKWGLLTLFILMAVVVGLVYDGGRNKKKVDAAQNKAADAVDTSTVLNGPDAGQNGGLGSTSVTQPAPAPSTGLGGNDTALNTPVPPTTQTPPPFEGPDLFSGGPHPGSGSKATGKIDSHAQLKINDGPVANGETKLKLPNEKPSRGAKIENNSVDEGKPYVVQSGDNLTRIASQHHLGKNGVKAILAANKEILHDANMLREGMKLKIPSSASTPSESHAQAAMTHGERNIEPSMGKGESYTVQSGDTLERIARRQLNDGNRWKDILDWNKDKISEPTKIRVGMVLRMRGGEVRAETVPVRGTGSAIRAEAPPREPSRHDHEANFDPNTEPEAAELRASPVSASRSVPQPQPAAASPPEHP